MHIDTLIDALQEERRKYGNIQVVIGNVKPTAIEDVATFSDIYSRKVWICPEPAE